MCFVLAPDIIVASQIGEKLAWDVNSKPGDATSLSNYSVSVGECLEKQKRLSRVGLGNVVAEVNGEEIKDFLERSGVFEYSKKGEYRLSYKVLKEWSEKRSTDTDRCGEFLRQNVLRKAYPAKTLRALSILQYN